MIKDRELRKRAIDDVMGTLVGTLSSTTYDNVKIVGAWDDGGFRVDYTVQGNVVAGVLLSQGALENLARVVCQGIADSPESPETVLAEKMREIYLAGFADLVLKESDKR